MTTPEPHDTALLSSLVLLYLAVAYGADHDFTEAEYRTVLHLAHRWAPALDAEALVAVVETARVAVRGFDGDVDGLARSLGGTLTPGVRRRVLADLGRIAIADGHLSVEEAGVIQRIRAAWGSA